MSSACFKGLVVASLMASLIFGATCANAQPDARTICALIKTRVNQSRGLKHHERKEVIETLDKYCLRAFQ
jgi:hypothetical protein